MKARDLLIVVGLVLIAGFAAADALREGAADQEPGTTRPSTTTGTTEQVRPAPQPDAPPGWPVGELPGTLVFTDAGDCRVRVIGLPGGRERPVPFTAGDCHLWAAPVGQRIAYGLGGGRGDNVPFRFLDLARPSRELGGFSALFGFIVWSPDGQRAAWCGRFGTGFDLDLGGQSRRLRECPAAYTPDGDVASAIGNRLVVGDRTVLRVDGGITFARYGSDGSLVVVVDGTRIERYEGRRRTDALEVPARLQGALPIFSPDNCAALMRKDEFVDLVDVGCFEGDFLSVAGRAAAWSPDGRWIAVAEDDEIAFYRATGTPEVIRWPAAAAELAWRAG